MGNYSIYFSINKGQTNRRIPGYTNLKQAKKAAREMALGNCPLNSCYYWCVESANKSSFGETIIEGRGD